MYDLLRRWTLIVLKAPADPHPPMGDPESLRIFRAGKNFLRLRMARWFVVELLALGGLIFWTGFLVIVANEMKAQQEAARNRPVAASEARPASKSATKRKAYPNWWAGFRQAAVDFALKLPAGAFALIWAIKIFSALFYIVQLPITYAVRRLDYEMRWYMVTDRSLRLRYGVWKISESTMSFANIQQVVVSQGPLQRLLGLGDVKVKSAGGGGDAGPHKRSEGDDMHTGLFHCVTNAAEIRDLIAERLRRFREAGLGDPDEKTATAPIESRPHTPAAETMAAAIELRNEARQLRAVLTPSSSNGHDGRTSPA